MNFNRSNVWLWTDPDSRWKQKLIRYVREKNPTKKDIVLLHCTKLEKFEESIPLTNYLFYLCQKFNIFNDERMMVLNPKDLLQAIELCLGKSTTKENKSDTEITHSDIVNCHKNYVSQVMDDRNNSIEPSALVNFVKQNNCIDVYSINISLSKLKADNPEFEDYLSDKVFIVMGHPSSDIFVDSFKILSSSNEVANIIVETPLDISLQGSPTCSSPSESVELSVSLLEIDNITINEETEETLGSATEEYVTDIILSFLSLLVNSRNELTLSKIMVSPFVDLNHDAFTKLKHLSAEKEMPMCQTAVSYVTRIKLGGKGYAPNPDCPMLPYLKSLELFVDTLNQMQTLIEEDLKPISALKRLINILKKKLVKCGSEKLRPLAVETACEQLKCIAEKVVVLTKTQLCASDTPQVNQECLDVLHFFVNYVNSCCWTFDPEKLLQAKQSKRTPINLPPLLGYFRSPDEEYICDTESIVNEDSVMSTVSLVTAPVVPISYFHHSDNSSMSQTCEEKLSPPKMSFEGCLCSDENATSIRLPTETPKHPKRKGNPSKGLKRSILSEITNDSERRIEKKPKVLCLKTNEPNLVTVAKKTKTAAKKETKAKQGKKFKLIEGQGKITSFFTMK